MDTKLARRVGALSLLTLGLAVAPPARAGDAMPTACTGAAVTDPVGDADVFTPDKAPGFFVPVEGSLDVREIFFTKETAADGKPRLRANIGVASLDSKGNETFYGKSSVWDVRFTTADGWTYIATATLKGGAWSFTFDHPEPLARPDSPLANRVDTTVTGKAHEGPNGVISIDIPTEHILDWSGSGSFTDVSGGSSVENSLYYSDQAPDDSTEGGTWDIGECPTVLPARPAPTPPAEPAATSDSGTGSGTATAPATTSEPPAQAAVTLPVTAPAAATSTAKKPAAKRKAACTKAKAKRKAAACKKTKKAKRKSAAKRR